MGMVCASTAVEAMVRGVCGREIPRAEGLVLLLLLDERDGDGDGVRAVGRHLLGVALFLGVVGYVPCWFCAVLESNSAMVVP